MVVYLTNTTVSYANILQILKYSIICRAVELIIQFFCIFAGIRKKRKQICMWCAITAEDEEEEVFTVHSVEYS